MTILRDNDTLYATKEAATQITYKVQYNEGTFTIGDFIISYTWDNNAETLIGIVRLTNKMYMKKKDGNTWDSDWVEVSTPSYLRSYSDLSSLASALKPYLDAL